MQPVHTWDSPRDSPASEFTWPGSDLATSFGLAVLSRDKHKEARRVSALTIVWLSILANVYNSPACSPSSGSMHGAAWRLRLLSAEKREEKREEIHRNRVGVGVPCSVRARVPSSSRLRLSACARPRRAQLPPGPAQLPSTRGVGTRQGRQVTAKPVWNHLRPVNLWKALLLVLGGRKGERLGHDSS